MKKFLCIKDVVMDGTGEKAYFKGKVYISEQNGCITNESGFIGHSWSSMVNEYFLELTPELIRQLSQMQPQPQLPVVETGVLKSPAEITKCGSVIGLEFKNSEGQKCYLNIGNPAIGSRLEMLDTVYPREFYKDIKTEIDYSKIPVGSIVKVFNGCLTPAGWVVKNDGKSIMVGLHKKYDPSYCLDVNYSNIKSIEIIRWGGK
jgi:hypothetical protein